MFADCMDSSMMNFLLILAYNNEFKEFSVEFLKQRLGLQALNEKLEPFLNSDHTRIQPEKSTGKERIRKFNLTPQTVEEIEVHNAWTDVEFRTFPAVAYNKCLRGLAHGWIKRLYCCYA